MPTDKAESKTHIRTALYLSVILLLGLVLRLVYLWQVSEYPNFHVPYPGMDVAFYHDRAKEVAAGNLLLGNNAYYYAPLYAYFLGGLYSLFGDSYWVARLANVIIGVGNIALIYFLTLRLFKSTGTALLAGLGAAIYGPLLFFDTTGLKTTLGLSLIALLLFLLSGSDQNKKPLYWVFTGLTAGLAFNLGGHMALFLPAICLWLLMRKPFQHKEQADSNKPAALQKRFQIVSLFVIGILIAVAPFALRNYYVSQDMILINSEGGIHLYIGNHEGAWGGYSRISGIRPNIAGSHVDAMRMAEKETGKELSDSEVSAYWKNRTYDFIKEHPGEFFALLGKKTLLLFSDYEVPNVEDYQYFRQKSSFLAVFPGIGILLPLGLCGMLSAAIGFRKKGFENRGLVPLFIFFFTFSLALVLTLVTWRYRLPLTVVLLPFASYFLVRSFKLAKSREFKALILSAVLLTGSWALTQASPVKKERSEWNMKRAAAKMKMSDRELIILKQLESASDPGDRDTGRLLFELADLRQKQFDIEGAIPILQKALALDPHQHRQWKTLSSMLRQLGHIEQAKKAKENAKQYRQRRSPRRTR